MKIHFTDDEDKVFNVPRQVLRIEAGNEILIPFNGWQVWRLGLWLGAGIVAGMALCFTVGSVVAEISKWVLK